jgi:hypothetical protein
MKLKLKDQEVDLTDDEVAFVVGQLALAGRITGTTEVRYIPCVVQTLPFQTSPAPLPWQQTQIWC